MLLILKSCRVYIFVIFVQLLSHVQIFATACQASLSSTVSWSLLKFMSIESVILPNHLIFSCPLLLLPSIFSSIRITHTHTHTHTHIIYSKWYYLYKNVKHLKKSIYCLWNYSKSLHRWKNDYTPTWGQRFHQQREREIQWSEEQE